MSNKIKPFSLAVQELRMILLLPLLSIAVVAAATEAVYAVAPALALAFAAPTSIALLKSGSMQNSLESLVFHYSQQAIHCCCFALLCFCYRFSCSSDPSCYITLESNVSLTRLNAVKPFSLHGLSPFRLQQCNSLTANGTAKSCPDYSQIY